MSDFIRQITFMTPPSSETSDDALALSPSCTFLKHRGFSADNLKEPKPKIEDIPVKAKDLQNKSDNLDSLKRLREQPRGTQVDSRIAAIRELLGETEIFKTLKMLRWPEEVTCPHCHSNNVIRRDPPASATDQRHHYKCLNCKGEEGSGHFDDFTGLPMGSLHSLRQWILCWYLLGFCSIAQISKVLGISIQEVLQMASIGNELPELGKTAFTAKADKEKKVTSEKKAKEDVERSEEYTRSASKSPKPGFKSKL